MCSNAGGGKALSATENALGGGMKKTESVKALIRPQGSSKYVMELQNRPGYTTTIDGDVVSIQRRVNEQTGKPTNTYFLNVFGMAASEPYSSLKEAKNKWQADYEKIKQKSAAYESAKAQYEAIMKRGDKLTYDDWRAVQSEVREKLTKRRKKR